MFCELLVHAWLCVIVHALMSPEEGFSLDLAYRFSTEVQSSGAAEDR